MDEYRGLRRKTRRDQQRRKKREMGEDGRSARLIWQTGLRRAEKMLKSKRNRRKSQGNLGE